MEKPVAEPEPLAIRDDSDITLVRQTVRSLARELSFGLIDQTKLVTAASELARNALVHGGGGTCSIETVRDNGRTGLRVLFEDRGPGISDVDQALQDGFTTGGGLGLGLGGARRLVHNFEVQSKPGQGTRIVIVRWK